MQLFSLLAARWVQRRRILLTSNQVSADTHILTHHHHKQQFSSSVLLPLLPSPFHSRRWPNQRNPSLRSPQPVWSSRADTWHRIARWVRNERRLGSLPMLSYPVLFFPHSLHLKEDNCPSLPISVHQRRWKPQCERWYWRRQEEVCELRHGSGDDSRHDDMRLLPAAGHDQRHLQGRDVRLADVSTLHLLRVRRPVRCKLQLKSTWMGGVFWEVVGGA